MRSFHRPPDIDPRDAKLDRATLGRILGLVRPYRGLLWVYLGSIVAASVLQVAPAFVFKRLIDGAIPHRDLASVNRLAVAAVAIAVLLSSLSLLNRWLGSRIGEGLIYDLRAALYRHVQAMPISFFTRSQTGSLLNRLNSDVVGAQGTVQTLAQITSDVMVLVSTLVAMVALSWKITVLSLVVLPGFFVVDRRLAPRLKGLSRRRMELGADMSTTMTERFNVSGALLVKLFGRPDEEQSRFAAQAAEVRDTGVTQAVLSRVLFALLALVGAVGTAAVYWYGARAVVTGELALGSVVALAALVARLYSPLTDLAGARVDVLTSMVAFERCFEVLDLPVAVRPPVSPCRLERPTGRVTFDDVWFRYPAPSSVTVKSLEAPDAPRDDAPSAWVLQGVSFVAEPGTMTALVGHSGAGKTTLSYLVPRLYDVERGQVAVDGIDVRELEPLDLVAAVGMVTQDAHLFHSSIAENLRYARPDATEAEVGEACRRARIGELVESLPDRYATVVGERGYRLSGGEKQRLALARLFLKNPAVVILDEATAHLDSETEALVQQALAEALSGRTSIVIAHRLSTVRAADQILVLEAGRIVERGTHDGLVEAGGVYADLYETQYRRGAPEPA
ncbi:MAG TPA: ABC transporter ATP-binding protein [Acidimicrobiales bacterium]|nr:ABC transporter ATP-binding protein [Acidimicrobiales bacterium]